MTAIFLSGKKSKTSIAVNEIKNKALCKKTGKPDKISATGTSGKSLSANHSL